MDEFHLFPQLPAEIQLKIWKHAAFIPRVVIVSYSNHLYPDSHERPLSHLQTVFVSPTPAPAMLAVCFIARQVGLKYYQLAFGTKERESNIYLNFEVDTVYMKAPAVNWNDSFRLWHSACNYLTGSYGRLLKCIRSFAIDIANIQLHEGIQIAEMTGLRELLIIADPAAPTASYLSRAEPRRPNPAWAFGWLTDTLVRRRNKFVAGGMDLGLDPRLQYMPAPLTMRLLKPGEDNTSFVKCNGVRDETIEDFPFRSNLFE